MKIQGIQYLRALAASAVVLQHAARAAPGDYDFHLGAYGVDLFFVISGFIMFFTTAHGEMGPGRFMVRRLIRIWPLYVLITLLAFGLAVIAPALTNKFSSEPMDFIRSILFVPFFNEKYGAVEPIVGQGWTLNYEMFFYIVFAVGLFLPVKLRLAFCWLVLGALSIVGLLVPQSDPLGQTYTDPIMLEFAFGMVIGYAAARAPEQMGWLALSLASGAILALGAWSFGVMLWTRFLTVGIPAAAIVAAAVWAESRFWSPNSKALVEVGNASYSLYLVHNFVVAVMWRITSKLFGNALGLPGVLMFVAITLAVAIGVAVPLYRLVEHPTTKSLNRRFARR